MLPSSDSAGFPPAATGGPALEWAPFAAALAASAAPLPPAAAALSLPPAAPADDACAAFLAAMRPVRVGPQAHSGAKRKAPAGGFDADAAQLPKSSSQLSLLLDAIDACERSQPGGHWGPAGLSAAAAARAHPC